MPELDKEGLPLINNLFKEYYKGVTDIAPDRISEREFGIGNFDVKIAQRHMSFKQEGDLKAYLSTNAVPYISYSAAYYKDAAGRPMEAKGWLGSELIFDLDVTDMNLPCHLTHPKSWICEHCLEGVKEETQKLIEDFLIPDFGFSDRELNVNFSGNRGYHVHIKREDVLKLDANARKEISSYISGEGLEFDRFFPNAGKKGSALMGPKPEDKGWGGKIARNFLKRLNDGTDALIGIGISRELATKIHNKRALIEMGIKRGNWDMVYIQNKADFWKKVINVQAIMQSDRIDRNVTKDPSHLIRMPNSLHGETGLIAKKIGSVKELDRFDPMTDAVAFRKKSLKIKADTRYGVVMNGNRYGPYKDAEVNVPIAVALYLYLKGLAKILF